MKAFKTGIQIWNVPLKTGRTIRVATIDQDPNRKEAPCAGCPAPCCRGMFRPVLDREEFLSRRYRTAYTPSPEWLKSQQPRADFLATLDVSAEKGCPYFDPATAKCSIWPNCPKSCLSYDCREDDRPEIRGFIEKFLKVSHGGNRRD